jgi:hypothetical protein
MTFALPTPLARPPLGDFPARLRTHSSVDGAERHRNIARNFSVELGYPASDP